MNKDHFEAVKELPEIKILPENVVSNRRMCVCGGGQAKLRLEMEMERLRQMHSKELENKDEEVEEIRQSCSKKVRQESLSAL